MKKTILVTKRFSTKAIFAIVIILLLVAAYLFVTYSLEFSGLTGIYQAVIAMISWVAFIILIYEFFDHPDK